jgi:hypothetical protein
MSDEGREEEVAGLLNKIEWSTIHADNSLVAYCFSLDQQPNSVKFINVWD